MTDIQTTSEHHKCTGSHSCQHKNAKEWVHVYSKKKEQDSQSSTVSVHHVSEEILQEVVLLPEVHHQLVVQDK